MVQNLMADGLKELIIKRLEEVKARGGFGQITIHIRNGYIYRVATTSEDYLKEDIPETLTTIREAKAGRK